MSLLSSVGLTAAARVERSVGASVALRSYQALLRGGEHAVLLPATLGAFRCALTLRDERELSLVADTWQTMVDVDAMDAVSALVVPLLLTARASDAVTIAASEAKRRPTARSAYLYARALETACQPSEHAYAACAGLASGEELGIRAAALSKQLSAMMERGADATAQLAVAERIDLQVATPAQKLLAAGVRLGASSRFARAAALSALEELAASAEPVTAQAAMRATAEHADSMAQDLTWVEADRVAAALMHWPIQPEREAALARLAARRGIASHPGSDDRIVAAAELAPAHRSYLRRAQATLTEQHLAAPSPSPHREIALADRCLTIVFELGRQRWQAAEFSVRELIGELRDGGDNPPQAAWSVAHRCSSADAQGVVLAGLELTALLLKLTRTAPLGGFLLFAVAAREWQASRLTEALLRRAVERGEPSARSWLCGELTRRARAVLKQGDRSEALSLLREAKALAIA